MVVEVTDTEFAVSYTFKQTWDWPGSWSAKTGEAGAEFVDTGRQDRLVFKVPEETTDITLAFHPKGSVTYNNKRFKEQTAQVDFPNTVTVEFSFA